MSQKPQKPDMTRDLDGDGDVDLADDVTRDLDRDGRIDGEDREINDLDNDNDIDARDRELKRQQEETQKESVGSSLGLSKKNGIWQKPDAEKLEIAVRGPKLG